MDRVQKMPMGTAKMAARNRHGPSLWIVLNGGERVVAYSTLPAQPGILRQNRDRIGQSAVRRHG